MSDYVLRHKETHAEIKEGDTITHRDTRHVWRFEKIVKIGEGSKLSGQLMLRVSRYDHTMHTRVSKLFHPHLFLLEIVVQVELPHHTVSFRQTWGFTKDQIWTPLYLGGMAWIFLAIADKTHLEDVLFNWIH